MSEQLTVYVGRDHQARYTLKQRHPETGDIVIVPEDAVIRAQLRLQGSMEFCIDTSNPDDPIELLDSATVLELRLGRIPSIQPGQYRGYLTLFDGLSSNGEPWGQGGERKDRPTFVIRVIEWPVCF